MSVKWIVLSNVVTVTVAYSEFVNEGGSAQQLILKDGTHTLSTAIPAKSIESIIWE